MGEDPRQSRGADGRARGRRGEGARGIRGVHGSQGLEVQPAPAAPTSIRDAFQQVHKGFQGAGRVGLRRPPSILDPGDADLNHPPAEEEDEARRAETIRAGERAAASPRAGAFKAAEHAEIAFTRIATSGRTQLEDVVKALVALRSRGRLRRLPRAGTPRAQPQQRGQGVRRVGGRAPRGRGLAASRRGPHRRVPARLALGRAPAGRAERDRRGHRGRARRHRAARARGLFRPQPPAEHPRRRVRGRQVQGPHRGRRWCSAASTLAARAAGADGPGAARHAARRRRSTSRSSTGRRSPRGSRPTATARRARPHRSRTCRATGRAADRVPADRRRAPRGHLRRADHPHLRGPIGDLSMASFRRNLGKKPKLPRRRRAPRRMSPQHVVIAYRDSAEYVRAASAGTPTSTRCCAPAWTTSPACARRSRSTITRGRRSCRRSVDMFNPLDPCTMFPQVFNRNERPSLGPYCGEA